MTPRHFRFWPKGLPRSLSFPRTPLHDLLEVSARRYPDKPASWFFGAALAWREVEEQALRLAGFLQRACGVRPGDRVLVDLQNSPQFVLAAFRKRSLPVFHVLRVHRPDGSDVEIIRRELFARSPFAVRGTPGAAVIGEHRCPGTHLP